MPGTHTDVLLIADDAELRAQVMRHKPPAATLTCLSSGDDAVALEDYAGQVWLDLECAVPGTPASAARRVYFYAQLPASAGGLAPGLFIRKPCSPPVFEVLWAGVAGGAKRARVASAAHSGATLPGWILDYQDLDLKSLCRKCVADLPRRLGYRQASLYVHDMRHALLTLAETTHARAIDLSVPLADGPPTLMGSVARRGVAFRTEDVRDELHRLGVASRTDRTYADSACLVVPLLGDGQLWGVLSLSGRDPAVVTDADAGSDAVFAFLGRALQHARLYDTARTEARLDSLTGLYNQRWMLEAMEKEIRRAQRFAATLCVLMIDVDALKAVNDRAGHAAGDCLLRHVAGRISAVLRQFDGAARVGGDEFLVMLPGTALAGAQQVARRLVDSIREDSAYFQDSPLPTTVSVGVTEWREGWDARQLMDAADQAMYRAKQQGRDNVVCHAPARPSVTRLGPPLADLDPTADAAPQPLRLGHEATPKLPA